MAGSWAACGLVLPSTGCDRAGGSGQRMACTCVCQVGGRKLRVAESLTRIMTRAVLHGRGVCTESARPVVQGVRQRR